MKRRFILSFQKCLYNLSDKIIQDNKGGIAASLSLEFVDWWKTSGDIQQQVSQSIKSIEVLSTYRYPLIFSEYRNLRLAIFTSLQ